MLKVVGLVTRKDLARYHLGKHGLEELDLAHPWSSSSLRSYMWKSTSIKSTGSQQSQYKNSKHCKQTRNDRSCDEPRNKVVCYLMEHIGTSSRPLGVFSSLALLCAPAKGSGWIMWNIFAGTFPIKAHAFSLRLDMSLFIAFFGKIFWATSRTACYHIIQDVPCFIDV